MALEIAGLEHLYNRPAAVTKSRTLARILSDDELLEEVRRVAQNLGSATLTADQIRQHATIGVDSLRRRFGSLRAALRAAGLIEVAHGRRYSDEECFGNLLSVWTHYGRAPAHAEMSLPPSVVGPKAYTSRWGGWRAALVAFVHRMEESNEAEPESKPTSFPVRRPKRATEDQHGIPLSLRYKVLKRDSFRCVGCGASPALTLGVELHVDHIIAFANGGKTQIENLRTLCKSCNLGKGAT